MLWQVLFSSSTANLSYFEHAFWMNEEKMHGAMLGKYGVLGSYYGSSEHFLIVLDSIQQYLSNLHMTQFLFEMLKFFE